jgi:hypothetical protein
MDPLRQRLRPQPRQRRGGEHGGAQQPRRQKYGQTLDGSLEELGARLVALWVITRQRDSVGLLKQFMAALPHVEVHVVRNGYFGDEKKFELYNASKVRETVESRGGKWLRCRTSPIGSPTTSM